MADTKLSLKLLVDKEKNKVVLAESQRDFVDVLFSFLTMPVGTVVRVLKKQSMLGCMDNLYESVEKMDLRFIETKACKAMLLRPRNVADKLCEDLKLNIDDTQPRRFYRCPKWDCWGKTFHLYSLVEDAKCPCGLTMDDKRVWTKKGAREDGVFVKGEGCFTINDDLRVTPSVNDAPFSVFHKFGVNDCSGLEEMTFEVGKEEMLDLLKRSLSSDTVLTDIFLRKLDMSIVAYEPKDPIAWAIKCEAPTVTKSLKMKLVQSKSGNTVLYAQAGGDVVDFLLSFLTFPVGSIIKLLERCSCIGCLDNLYKSVEELIGTDCLVDSGESARMLLSPKLAPTFTCSSQLLRIEEEASTGALCRGCEDCFNRWLPATGSMCEHGIEDVTLTAVNPKLPSSGKDSGGGFTKGREGFMITDELEITTLSSISSIQAVGRAGIPVSDLVVREVSLGESEARKILKASLVSNRALSSVFCERKRKHSLV